MKRNNESGMALLLVLIVSILIIGVVSAMSLRTIADNNQTTNSVEITKASEGADAGLELAANLLWGQFAGTTLTDFDAFAPMAPGATAELLGAPVQLAGGATITSVRATRDPNGQDFTIESTATSGSVQRTAVSNARVGGSPFGGFGYAVLANNINCIMCHADFDTVERVNNTDPTKFGTFDRIKIASLESLNLRPSTADSILAGSYYTRGSIKSNTGASLSDLSGTTVTGFSFDAHGKLLQDSDGDMITHDLDLASTDAQTGLYDPNEYLYTDYPTTEAEMTDGDLPTEFPPVIPDANGDRLVNGTEFSDFIATMTPGTMDGGVIYGVDPGNSFSGTSLPGSDNAAATDLLTSGLFDGNLILVGTPGNPIILDGPVFIDGDVVITGTVEGTGQIIASGNMYFVGDTTYNDGGNFGESSAGGENLAAFAAGGNIIVGDYLSLIRHDGSYVDVTSSSYLSASNTDQGGPPNSGQLASFTTAEMTLFNKIEYQKWQSDSSYVPRFYALDDTSPAYWYSHPTKEVGLSYDSNYSVVSNAELSSSNAAVVTLNPQNNWVSESFLKNVWQQDELSRPSTGRPFQIDGLLYTNNSIMALTRTNFRNKSRTFGQLKVQGGMVAADLGMLSPGNRKYMNSAQKALFGVTSSGNSRGFVMLYDPRVDGFLSVEDLNNLSYTKRVRVFVAGL